MKPLYRYLLIVIFTSAVSSLCAQKFVWVKPGPGAATETGTDVAVDKMKFTYVTGFFDSTLKFGTQQLNSAGGEDIFVAKFDSGGTLLWLRQAGGPGNDRGLGIAVNDSGNVYVTGFIEGSFTFSGMSVSSKGKKDVFIAKFGGNNGILQWVKTAGGTGEDQGTDIVCDNSGNSFISGFFEGSITFGTNATPSKGGEDAFMAHLDNAGNFNWTRAEGGLGDDRATGLAFNQPNGRLYLAGTYTQQITIGSKTLLSLGIGKDVFIAQYSMSGSPQWADKMGGAKDDDAHGLAADPLNNIYVTGSFSDAFLDGTGNILSRGSNDMFLAKYDGSGNRKWVRTGGGPLLDEGYAVACGASGDVFVAGSFGSDTAEFSGTYLNSKGLNDIFVARYDGGGMMRYVKRAGGIGMDAALGMAVKDSLSGFITGHFSQGATFDTISVNPQRMQDAFVARVDFTPKGLIADFTATPSQGCPPLTVTFRDSSSGPPQTWEWNFGDGSTYIGKTPPAKIYTAPGVYIVTLRVTGGNGTTSDSIKKNIVVFEPPKADFAVPQVTGCIPFNVLFSDSSAFSPAGGNSIVSWQWEFNPGTDVVQNPTRIFSTPGQYDVSLTVTDKNGCSHKVTKPKYISVFPKPLAGFKASPLTGCQPLPVAFTDTSKAAPVSGGTVNKWEWSFGDSFNSSLQSPVHTYLSAGTYSVKLKVTDANGCSDSVMQASYIVVNPKPNAQFTSDTAYACLPPHQVTFDGQPSGTGSFTYYWDFANGNAGNGKNPKATYPVSGKYTVTLVVTDPNGCRDTMIKPDYVRVDSIKAGAVIPVKACANEPVNFTDLLAVSHLFRWTFGDTSAADTVNKNPVHVYKYPGTYGVKLVVGNTLGCKDSVTQLIDIKPVPSPQFTASDSLGCNVPFTVNFSTTATSSVAHSWTFGDGGSSASATPAHVYTAPGIYTVKHVVSSTDGCRDSLEKLNYIRIGNINAGFTQDKTTGCPPLGVAFTDTTKGVASRTWDLGDGSFSNLNILTHFYNNSGPHTIKLIVRDSAGCADTATGSVSVHPRPTMDYVIVDSASCKPPYRICFTENSPNAIVSAWAVNGDTIWETSHCFELPDTVSYVVSHAVANIFGCYTYGYDTVRAKLSTICNLNVYNGFSPNNDNRNDFWEIEGIENFPQNSVSIHNRWGAQVWFGKNYDNRSVVWKGDGDGGSLLPAGTYYYVITTGSERLSGWVELIR